MYTAWHCKAGRRPRGMYVVRTREYQDTIYTTHFARDQDGAPNFWLSQSESHQADAKNTYKQE